MQSRARAHYATIAMLELAMRESEPQPIALRDIASAHHVPLPFLTQILQQLKLAGLVTSLRGSSGGYRLSRAASSIKLSEIIDAVSPRVVKEPRGSQTPVVRVVEKLWEDLDAANRERLQQIRLHQLVQQASQSSEMMFYI